MRVTLTKQQALVAKAAGQFSEPLEHVRIADGQIVAADGFMLARAPVDYDGEPVFVPSRIIPSGPCDVEMDGKTVRVITAETTREAPHATYDYPDTEKVWQLAAKHKPKACVALNVALIRKMLACIEGKDGGKSSGGMVRLYIRRPEDAVEWKVQTPDGSVMVEGLIEPMFTSWEEKNK